MDLEESTCPRASLADIKPSVVVIAPSTSLGMKRLGIALYRLIFSSFKQLQVRCSNLNIGIRSVVHLIRLVSSLNLRDRTTCAAAETAGCGLKQSGEQRG